MDDVGGVAKPPRRGGPAQLDSPDGDPPAGGSVRAGRHDGVATGAKGLHAYFVHSFHFAPVDSAHVLAHTDYGAPLTAAVARDNLVGVQFHPEKSQRLGLALIANYLRWRP